MATRSQPGERLQKYLAGLGVGSRRKIEAWIAEGKIRVNGKVAQLGDRVSPGSQITVNGRAVRSRPTDSKRRVLIYNKPEGEICTRSDPEGRPTVFKKLPRLKGERWVAVGRLDINTRGLMLFTNDGQYANYLMHPSRELEREYLCRVFGQVDKETIARLKEGIELDGQLTLFHFIRRQGEERNNTWYSVVVKEGKYREIRRMWEAVGCRLSRLVRVRYGNIGLPKALRQGHWAELEPEVIAKITDPVLGNKPFLPKVQNRRSRSGRK